MLTAGKILDLVKQKGIIKNADLVRLFGVSRQYAARLILRLIRENKLVKIGSTRSAAYTTEEHLARNPELIPVSYSKTLVNSSLEEHRVLIDLEGHFPAVSKCPENIKSIFEYAFSEMLNNAIEHSKSKKIKFAVSLNKNVLSFIVDDYGIGVFRSIMRKRNLNSETEAIQDLIKGKTTTSPRLHSGEGIFFTSKSGDEFVLDSYGWQFIVDNKIKDIFIKKVKGQKLGTRVVFRINTAARHQLNDIFNQNANI